MPLPCLAAALIQLMPAVLATRLQEPPAACAAAPSLATVSSARHPRTRVGATLAAAAAMLLLCPAPAVLGQTAVSGGQTTFASGLGYDSSVGTDANGNVYVTNSNSTGTYRFSPTGVPTQLNSSYYIGVVVDSSGNVYVGDSGHISKLGPGGTSSLYAYLPSSVRALAIDAQGNLYAATQDGSITKVTPSGIHTTLVSSSPFLQSVAVDTAGNVYYSGGQQVSILNGYVNELKTDGTTINIASRLGTPSVAPDAAGNVYVADDSVGTLTRYAADTHAQQTVANGRFNGIAFDPTGNIFLPVFQGSVTKIAFAGPVNFGSVNVCPAGQTTPAPCTQTEQLTFTITGAGVLGAPVALTQGTTGLDFSVASTNCTGAQTAGAACTVDVSFSPLYPGARNGAVELVDAAGNVLATTLVYGTGRGPQIGFSPGTQTTVPGSMVGVPSSVAVDGAGNVYAVDQAGHRVVKIAAGSGAQTTVPTGAQAPNGLALDGAGNLFVADASGNAVYKVSSQGNSQAVYQASSSVSAVAVDGAGNVFVSVVGGTSVTELPAGGSAPTAVGSGLNLGSVSGLAVDAAGDVFVTDEGNNRVVEIPAGGGPQTAVGSGFYFPISVVVDAAGNVFVSDIGTNQITEMPAGGGPKITVGAFASYGIGLDGMGNLFVADVSNNRVVEFNRSQAPSFNFTTTSIGSLSADSPMSTQLQNIGNQALTSNFPGLVVGNVGGNFAQVAGSGTFPDCTNSFSLTPGALCNISIDFTPQQAGPLQSVVLILENSLNAASQQTIPLSGTGALDTTTISFSVPNQTYSATPFQVTATSNSTGPIIYSVVSGPATISGNTVTLTGAGTVQLQASQVATATYSASSASVSFSVTKAATTATLTGSIIPSPGNTATLTTTVAPQNAGTYPVQPSGTVTFYNGAGVSIGSAGVVAGMATLTTPPYSGVQSFTAIYNGDANYVASAPSNSLPLTFSIPPAITFSTASSYAYGQSFQLMATSNSAGAFTYSLVSGPAMVTSAGTVTVTGEGPVVVQATEAAAPGYKAGSKQANFSATQATSSTRLTATAIKSGNGSAASLTATVAPQFSGTPSGSVTFYDGATKLATVALASGSASYTSPQLAGAQHSFSATYSGDTNLTGSTSNSAPLSIPMTAVSLQLASTNLFYPLPPTFAILVSPASGKPAPTGIVTIYDGTTAVGMYTLYAQAQGHVFGLVLPPLNVGTHPLTAVYSGDSNYSPGTSVPVTATVTPGPVRLELSCQNTGLKVGQTLTCIVDADEGPVPVTGTVTYTVSGGGAGSLTLDTSGHATITYPTRQKGSFTLTANYTAQGNYQAAPSAIVNYAVN